MWLDTKTEEEGREQEATIGEVNEITRPLQSYAGLVFCINDMPFLDRALFLAILAAGFANAIFDPFMFLSVSCVSVLVTWWLNKWD